MTVTPLANAGLAGAGRLAAYPRNSRRRPAVIRRRVSSVPSPAAPGEAALTVSFEVTLTRATDALEVMATLREP